MDKIIPPIRQQDVGPSVVNLQTALLFIIEKKQLVPAGKPLGFWKEMLNAEIAHQVFGPRTKDLFSALSVILQLPAADFVNEPVAETLNKLLQGLGAFVEPPPPPPPDDDPTLQFTIRGRVFSSSRAGVGGLSVQIVDKNVGNDIVVATTVTDADGGYHVDFTISDLHARNKQRADLQARVVVGTTPIAYSLIRYDASNVEQLNILLSESASGSLPSEYETLIGAIAGLYQGNLRDLQETTTRQDITYLANKTGWDARAVALAALAEQFSQRTTNAAGSPQIPAPFIYALFRAGLPADEKALYRVNGATLNAVWSKAVEQGVIPQKSNELIPDVVAKFQTLSAQQLLTSPAITGVSALNQMLAVSRLTDAQQQQFAALYTANSSDPQKLWASVTTTLGEQMSQRLQLDSKLAFMTLNNASLMEALHKAIGDNALTDPLQLVQAGYHRAEKWDAIVAAGMQVPDEIVGEGDDKRQNYKRFLAAQLRLSYPTASVAQLMRSDDPALKLQFAGNAFSDEAHNFLNDHQTDFVVGVEPIHQYMTRSGFKPTDNALKEINRLHRVLQITPDDDTMNGLLRAGVESAHQVVKYDRDAFIQSYKKNLGGEENATQVYDRSVQVHNVILHVAMGFLHARTAPAIGVHSPAGIINPLPAAANVNEIIPYPTLAKLFNSVDYCDCEHCRSILSPAAYLVDLLQFLDGVPADPAKPIAYTESSTGNQKQVSPLDILIGNKDAKIIGRRPDIQYLPLTCENTNTILPYIDVVNEMMEFFVVNKLSLGENQPQQQNEFFGHDTGSVQSDDLLSSPQNIIDEAYDTLLQNNFPPPLPFHRPLENLRKYFNKFDIPLQLAMEKLRTSDAYKGGANDYGWFDILIEEIGFSRKEYDLLTTSLIKPNILSKIYGFPDGTSDDEVIVNLSNAKRFATRMGITYDDIYSILQTRFVNPNSDLVTKLTHLGVSLATLKALKDGKLPDGTPFSHADFDKALPGGPAQPDPNEFGGDIIAWVKQDDNYKRIMKIIQLTIPTWAPNTHFLVGDCVTPTAPNQNSSLYYQCQTEGISAPAEPASWPTDVDKTLADGTVTWVCKDGLNSSDFGSFAFRYTDPAALSKPLGATEYVRMLRFIRLWKKLGWTVEQTDAAISALLPVTMLPTGTDDVDSLPGKLNPGFENLLPRLGIILRVMKKLNLKVKLDLLPALTLWSDIGTYGNNSLYRKLFLNPTILTQDDIFADDGYGIFLQRVSVSYTNSSPSLKKSITVFAPGMIAYDAAKGQLSFSGFLDAKTRDLLKTAGGTNKFQAAVDGLFASQFLAAHSQALRSALNITDNELAQIAQSLNLSLAVSAPLTLSTAYSQPQVDLDPEIVKTDPLLVYDNNAKTLSRNGFIDASTSAALKALPGVTDPFKTAVDALTLNQAIFDAAPSLIYDNGKKSLLFAGVISKTLGDAVKNKASALKISADFAKTIDNLVTQSDAGSLARMSIANISSIYRQGWLARVLKISVQELLLLVKRSGLDPFLAPDVSQADSFPPACLKIVDLLETMKQRSFKTASALFLMWNDDLSGKSEPDPDQVNEFARTLRADCRAIDDQFAPSADPGTVAFRNLITMVYDQDVADNFFSFLDGTLTFEVMYNGNDADLSADKSQLRTEITSVNKHISYDRLRHRLSYTGVLTDAQRGALEAVANVSGDFTKGVEALFSRCEDIKGSFFNLHQELEPLYEIDGSGDIKAYLSVHPELGDHFNGCLSLDNNVVSAPYTQKAAALDPAIAALDANLAYDGAKHLLLHTGRLSPDLVDNLKAVMGVTSDFQTAVTQLFSASQDARRQELSLSFRPDLVRRRKRQEAIQRLAAAANLDINSVVTLMDPPSSNTVESQLPLHAANHTDKPALDDIILAETYGLSAQFFYNDKATGAPDLEVGAAANLDYALLPKNPVAGKVISALWSGQIETPEAGFYNLIVEVDNLATTAAITLTINDTNYPMTRTGTIFRNREPLELKGGTLYHIEIAAESVVGKLAIKWETPKRQREVIPACYLYPDSILTTFTETYIRYLKVASLKVGLGLTMSEFIHAALDPDYRINAATGVLDPKGESWLNHLGNPADTGFLAVLNCTLLNPLVALLNFARIKKDISPDDEALLNILNDPKTATDNSTSLLFTRTQWDKESLYTLLNRFAADVSGLKSLALFSRVYDVFAMMKPMGITASALIRAATNNPNADTVRDLQSALRARYDTSNWRDLVRPINDEMRDLQRDALVAYILHQMRSNPDSQHIDTPDKLFEYFLTDVQMEPCQQTSRIRHALSSVQLFIDRCIMNLELSVSPAAFNNDKLQQWQWMKRYRIWEANRKVFFWPENWLEPELRDNKSPFFKELESELLQNDITEDAAATAMRNYLSKLEEVAKLEPCGVYLEDKNDVTHVVARTAGAHRKYYYRKKEDFWTPWEQIKLDIEDNPIIPVRWRDRLFLFWLRMLTQAPKNKPTSPAAQPTTSLANVDASKVITSDDPQVTVQVVLCWSEYFNDKWQPAKTSDVKNPINLDSVAADKLDEYRAALRLYVLEDTLSGSTTALRIVLESVNHGNQSGAFSLYNTHSLPVKGGLTSGANDTRQFPSDSQTFKIAYGSYTHDVWASMHGDLLIRAVQPCNVVQDPVGSPFLYEDSKHVFLVTSSGEMVTVQDGPSIVDLYGLNGNVLESAPLQVDPGYVDPPPESYAEAENKRIRFTAPTSGIVNYEGHDINQFGSITNEGM